MSLFSVLDNEVLGDSWLWCTEGQREKRVKETRSKQVATRHQPTSAGSGMALSITHTAPTPGLYLPAPEACPLKKKEGKRL